MPSEGRGILSPVRLPVPPLQQVYGSFEFTSDLRQAAHLSGPEGRDKRYRRKQIVARPVYYPVFACFAKSGASFLEDL